MIATLTFLSVAIAGTVATLHSTKTFVTGFRFFADHIMQQYLIGFYDPRRNRNPENYMVGFLPSTRITGSAAIGGDLVLRSH